MAIKRGKVIAITSVKGGTGKTTTALNLAGVLSLKKKKILIIDGDLYNGGIAASLNLEYEKDLYILINDMATNRFDNLDNYIKPYNSFIDVLASSKDPRNASKLVSKYIRVLIAKARMRYDVILIDLNHVMDANNLTFLDEADLVYYVITNDLVDIKGIKTMMAIYSDIGESKYRLILNEAKDKLKPLFSKMDVKNIIKNNLNYVIPSSFYLSNINEFMFKGSIITTNKIVRQKYKNTMQVFEKICMEILDAGEQDEKEETTK